MKLALLTEEALSEPDLDLPPLVAAARELGHEAIAVPWGGAVPAGIDAAILRSTWSYHRDLRRFLNWLAEVEKQTLLFNPLSLVRRNSHKGYLVDLAARGIPVVPTTVLTSAAVAEAAPELFEGHVVVKPAVSCGSHCTLAFRDDATGALAHAQTIGLTGDVLVQPYMGDVDDRGERSIVVIDGAISHSMRKARRLCGELESVTGPYPIGANEQALVHQLLDTLTERPLYARIDLVQSESERPQLMELELIEPSLFFYGRADAAFELVRAAGRRLALS